MKNIGTVDDVLSTLRQKRTECFAELDNGNERIIWVPPHTNPLKGVPGIGRIAKPIKRLVIVYEIDLATDEIVREKSYDLLRIRNAVSDFMARLPEGSVKSRTYKTPALQL